MTLDCKFVENKGGYICIYNSAYALRNSVFKNGDEVIEIVNTL